MGFRFLLCLTFLAGLLGCQTKDYKKEDLAQQLGYRHGWVLFSGPKPSVLEHQDKNTLGKGKALYQEHCLKCHGKSGKGDGFLAAKKGLKPADLTTFNQIHEGYYLIFQIRHGKGDMPDWKDVLSSQDIKSLSHYVRSLSKK